MKKVIGAINMSVDGYCDHDTMLPDEAIHRHFEELIENSSVILYGRKTYELMTYWKSHAEKPSGEKSMDDFAKAIDAIPKIVFSRTLKSSDIDWKTTRLSDRTPEEEVTKLRCQPGKNILVGCRSLIVQLMNTGLLDELQLCVHPVLTAGGLPLFDQLKERTVLQLGETKTFAGGAVNLTYRVSENK